MFERHGNKLHDLILITIFTFSNKNIIAGCNELTIINNDLASC